MMSKLLIVFAIILVQQHFCDSRSLEEPQWRDLFKQAIANIEQNIGFYEMPSFDKSNLTNRNTVFRFVSTKNTVLYGFGLQQVVIPVNIAVKKLGNGVTEISSNISAPMQLNGVTHFETEKVYYVTHFRARLSKHPAQVPIQLLLHFTENTKSVKVVKMDYEHEDSWIVDSYCNYKNIYGITKKMCEDIDAAATKFVLDGAKIKEHVVQRFTRIIEAEHYTLQPLDS